MANHNGYVLEQLYSPLVVVTTAAHEELMQLGNGCVTRPTMGKAPEFAWDHEPHEILRAHVGKILNRVQKERTDGASACRVCAEVHAKAERR